MIKSKANLNVETKKEEKTQISTAAMLDIIFELNNTRVGRKKLLTKKAALKLLKEADILKNKKENK